MSLEIAVMGTDPRPDESSAALDPRDRLVRNTGRPTAAAPRRHTTLTELYLPIKGVDALTIAIARLNQTGATALSPLPEEMSGDEPAYFADPDGNIIATARELTVT